MKKWSHPPPIKAIMTLNIETQHNHHLEHSLSNSTGASDRHVTGAGAVVEGKRLARATIPHIIVFNADAILCNSLLFHLDHWKTWMHTFFLFYCSANYTPGSERSGIKTSSTNQPTNTVSQATFFMFRYMHYSLLKDVEALSILGSYLQLRKTTIYHFIPKMCIVHSLLDKYLFWQYNTH